MLSIKDNYYRIDEQRTEGTDTVFRITLLPACEVYRGHFPGRPVCPGVCNIQVVKECAEQLTGQSLFIGRLKQCRLTAIATPDACRQLDIRLTVTPSSEGLTVAARMYDERQTYMELKGELHEV